MRLIDADSLIEECYKDGAYGYVDALQITTAPTIEAEFVRHGQWEWFEEWLPSTPDHPEECEDCGWRCSECKTALEDIVGGYWDDIDREPMINYCPNCGVKMATRG